MKNKLFTSLIVVGLLGVSMLTTIETKAETVSKLLTASVTTNLVPTSCMVNSITIANAGTNGTATVSFYSAPSNSLTYVVAAYTNYAITTGYTTNIYTNVLSGLETNIYASVTKTLQSNPQTTNNFTLLTSFLVPVTSTVSTTNRFNAARGLTVTNSVSGTNMTITVDYTPY